jgi:hypothetical protein
MRRLTMMFVSLALMLVAVATAFASGHAARVSAANASRCASGLLVTTVTPPSAASGHLGIIVRFINLGPQCILRGYPHIYGLTALGRTTARAHPSLGGYLPGGTAVTNVTLPRGGMASALLQGLDPAFLDHPCPKYGFLKVAAPGTTNFVLFPSRLPFCDLEIRPVVSGRSGVSDNELGR